MYMTFKRTLTNKLSELNFPISVYISQLKNSLNLNTSLFLITKANTKYLTLSLILENIL